jgi:hypothetical protein
MSENEQVSKKARHEPIRNADDGLFVGDTFLLVCMEVPLSSISALSQVQYQWRAFANQHAREILLNHRGMHRHLQNALREMFAEEGEGTRDVDGTLQVCGRGWFSYLSFFEQVRNANSFGDAFSDYIVSHLLLLPPRIALIITQWYLPRPWLDDTGEEIEYGSTNLTMVANELRLRIIPMLSRWADGDEARAIWQPHPDLLDLLSLLRSCISTRRARDTILGDAAIETLLLCFMRKDLWPWLIELYTRGYETVSVISGECHPLTLLEFLLDVDDDDYTLTRLEENDCKRICAMFEAYERYYRVECDGRALQSAYRKRNKNFCARLGRVHQTLREIQNEPWFNKEQCDYWRRIMDSFYFPFH